MTSYYDSYFEKTEYNIRPLSSQYYDPNSDLIVQPNQTLDSLQMDDDYHYYCAETSDKFYIFGIKPFNTINEYGLEQPKLKFTNNTNLTFYNITYDSKYGFGYYNNQGTRDPNNYTYVLSPYINLLQSSELKTITNNDLTNSYIDKTYYTIIFTH